MTSDPHDARGIIRKIFKIEERIKTDTAEVGRLYRLIKKADKRGPQAKINSHNEHSVSSEGETLNLRDTITEIFRTSKAPSLKINDVQRAIRLQYHLEPDKIVVTSRMNYMADRDKTLERVPNRRGFYRLPTKTTNASESVGG